MRRSCLVFICVILLLSDVSAKGKRRKANKKVITQKPTTVPIEAATGSTAPNGVSTEVAFDGKLLDIEIADGTVTGAGDEETIEPTSISGSDDSVTHVVEVLPTDGDLELLTLESDVLYTVKEEVTTEGATASSTAEGESTTEDGTSETTTSTDESEVTTDEAETNDRTSVIVGADATGTSTTGTGGTTGTDGTTGTGGTTVTATGGTYATTGTTEEVATEWFSTEFLTTPDRRFQFICPSYMYSCRRTEKCIGLAMVCDGKDDCGGNDDERDCPEDDENNTGQDGLTALVKCNSEEIRCNSTNSCILNFLKCNGIKDCSNGEDEENCPILKCTHDHNLCNDKKKCVPAVDWCDGKKHCDDGSDETNCVQELKCSIWDKQCKSGDCIEAIYWCDGYADCWDYSDETDCGAVSEFKKRR